MADIKDGGAAFPTKGDVANYPWPGMSLRDWFAGQALGGVILLAMEVAKAGLPAADPKIMARQAYEIADAMLVEGEKGNG